VKPLDLEQAKEQAKAGELGATLYYSLKPVDEAYIRDLLHLNVDEPIYLCPHGQDGQKGDDHLTQLRRELPANKNPIVSITIYCEHS
jgi:hypothetical protein